MENFLIKFTPVSSITIFTALYKRLEANKQTNKRDKEIKYFINIYNISLSKIHKNDKERLERLRSFGTGDDLKNRVSY